MRAVDPRFRELSKPFDDEESAYKDVHLGRTFKTIDAYHIVQRLTEVFGLCGQGWGCEVTDWRVNESNVAAIGHLWYRGETGDETYRVSAVGDAQILKGNVAEALKKAQTNLISKASSYIGVGLSVYQGKGIDDPYLDREHEARESGKARPPSGTATKADWSEIQDACADAQIDKDALRAILGTAPFCCADAPTSLLSIHVPALLSRIGKAGSDAVATPAPTGGQA